MKRRDFSMAALAAAATTLAGCGGGGGNDGLQPSAPGGEPPLASPAPAPDSGSGPAVEPTPLPEQSAPATPSGGIAYPFGARIDPYVAGIAPSVAKPVMDAALKNHYTAWKAHAVADVPGVNGGKAIKFGHSTTFLTVSEGMGYGMLLAVLFAGHDAGAQTLFDGLLTTVRARPAYGVVQHHSALGKYLMDWRLYSDGSTGGEGWNAMDGDEDIAMALLMADRQWGSGGAWNYKEEALNTIAAMKAYNFAADGTTRGLKYSHVSRTSDYMFGHFRAYQKATGDAFWTKAVDRAYYLTDLMQTQFSSSGLVPDFVVYTDSNPMPSPGFMGDGNADEHHYWWNACRNPWRYASDYLLSGDPRIKLLTTRMMNFFQAEAASSGDVTGIGTGYALNGFQLAGGDSPAYHGPICAGACVDPAYQGFLDAMWAWNTSRLTTGYYDGEIQLLSLAVASGNWWTP